ncbi:hypothetical protein VMT65_06775 [Nocardia sp. CDC153]|nr:hypothetical protein [Nocardia sp. CDC153]MEC3952729.1 hypothetical protein [Nocardia sp. CDC153]
MTWHNKPHDWTWSTTRGASPCRLQARLQRELSAGEPPVDRLPFPGIQRPSDAVRAGSLISEA